MLSKSTANFTIEKLIFETPQTLIYSKDEEIEIMPGVYSPIFLDFKKMISDPQARSIIVKQLITFIKKNKPDIICGVESGGSYYASAIADALNLPLILLRKENKNYGNYNRIIGKKPPKNKKILLIDDVLATGSTLLKAKTYLSTLNCQLEVLVIFSYGYDKQIGQQIKLTINSLSNFNNLCQIGLQKNIFEPKDINYLKTHVSSYKEFLSKPFKIA
jgi:orotate phosphoribosyltransferase